MRASNPKTPKVVQLEFEGPMLEIFGGVGANKFQKVGSRAKTRRYNGVAPERCFLCLDESSGRSAANEGEGEAKA